MRLRAGQRLGARPGRPGGGVRRPQPHLAARHSGRHPVTAQDVIAAAADGDPTSIELITRAGHRIGIMLAAVVNTHNPGLVLIGGGVAAAGDLLLAAVRKSVYHRAMPLATRDLRIELSLLGDRAGLVGAAFMATDELLSRRHLGHWIGHGTPAGTAGLIHQ
ncbi:ROK family protein [Phytohabitans suffuscus]|nr:ROK family protein [Phytohabitans suffuscus]